MNNTTEPPSSKDTSTTQTSPVDPQPFGPREPQPYRVGPRSPTPPPRDDDPSLQASHFLPLKEVLRMRMVKLKEMNNRVNDPSPEHIDGDRNHTATGPGTSEHASRGGNHAQNQSQDHIQRHITETQASDRKPRWVHVVKIPNLAIIALGLVSWSAIIGGLGTLGWKFWHSQLGGEMFAEVVAGSEALMVVGRGLMGVGAAVGRGVWAVVKHFGRNLGPYALLLGAVFQVVGAIAETPWFQAQYGARATCYCYACRVEMARAIKRETGVSPAELHARVGTSRSGDDWE